MNYMSGFFLSVFIEPEILFGARSIQGTPIVWQIE